MNSWSGYVFTFRVLLEHASFNQGSQNPIGGAVFDVNYSRNLATSHLDNNVLMYLITEMLSAGSSLNESTSSSLFMVLRVFVITINN